jgi:hypothetical protein
LQIDLELNKGRETYLIIENSMIGEMLISNMKRKKITTKEKRVEWAVEESPLSKENRLVAEWCGVVCGVFCGVDVMNHKSTVHIRSVSAKQSRTELAASGLQMCLHLYIIIKIVEY